VVDTSPTREYNDEHIGGEVHDYTPLKYAKRKFIKIFIVNIKAILFMIRSEGDMSTGSDHTKAFADRLSDLIDAKKHEGKSFKEIAAESGVPTGSLSKYQNDAAEAGVNSLVKLAKYFGVSTDYLLGITDIANGNADDMAIEKRLGFNSHTINEFTHFMDPEDEDSVFINLLSATGFWEIIYDLGIAFNHYTLAMRDEILEYKNRPEDRLMYSIDNANYQPVRNEDDLGFTLSLTAEHYFIFCLQKACSDFEDHMIEMSQNLLTRIQDSTGERQQFYVEKRLVPIKTKEKRRNGSKKEKHHP